MRYRRNKRHTIETMIVIAVALMIEKVKPQEILTETNSNGTYTTGRIASH